MIEEMEGKQVQYKKKIIKLGQNFGIIKGGSLTKIHSHNRTIEVFVMKYNILNHEK